MRVIAGFGLDSTDQGFGGAQIVLKIWTGDCFGNVWECKPLRSAHLVNICPNLGVGANRSGLNF